MEAGGITVVALVIRGTRSGAPKARADAANLGPWPPWDDGNLLIGDSGGDAGGGGD